MKKSLQNNYKKLKKLGKGNFGDVIKVESLDDKKVENKYKQRSKMIYFNYKIIIIRYLQLKELIFLVLKMI